MKEVKLPFPDMKACNARRQMLYRLRNDMEKEGHPTFPLASKVSMSCIYELPDGEKILFFNHTKTPAPPKPFKVYLWLRPRDLQDEDILEKAGYKIPEVPTLD